LTVCSLTVLTTGIAAFIALSSATPPLALGFGGLGMIAAFLGLCAVIQWARQAEWLYPGDDSFADYSQRLMIRAREQLAECVTATNRAESAYSRRVLPLHGAAIPNYGGNVVPFDLVRLRTRHQRLHRL
jgi:hypothetical protein